MEKAIDFPAAYNAWLKKEAEKEGVIRDLFSKSPLAFSLEDFSFPAIAYFAPAFHTHGLREERMECFISPCRDPPTEVRVLTGPVDAGDVVNEESICSFPSALCKFCHVNIYNFCGSSFSVDSPETFAALCDAGFSASRNYSRKVFDTRCAELWRFEIRMAINNIKKDCELEEE